MIAAAESTHRPLWWRGGARECPQAEGPGMSRQRTAFATAGDGAAAVEEGLDVFLSSSLMTPDHPRGAGVSCRPLRSFPAHWDQISVRTSPSGGTAVGNRGGEARFCRVKVDWHRHQLRRSFSSAPWRENECQKTFSPRSLARSRARPRPGPRDTRPCPLSTRTRASPHESERAVSILSGRQTRQRLKMIALDFRWRWSFVQ